MSDGLDANAKTFLRRAFHDLRAPVRHVTQFAALLRPLLSDPDLDPAALDYLAYIDHASNRMTRLLDRMRDYLMLPTAVESLETIDVAELIENAWASLLSEIAPGSLTIDGQLSVDSDIGLLSVAVTEILRNCLDFQHDQRDLKVLCQLRRDGSHAIVDISDNGIGIDPKLLDRATEPFERLGPTDKRGAAGIGLALSQRAIGVLGGTVKVASDGKCGTQVQVTWPLIEA